MITQRAPDKYLVKLGTPESPASVEKVLSELSSASIVHSACPGRRDRAKPLETALLLGDSDLNISKMMEHALPDASLAFLNTCETAMGDENVPDEAIHIAAAMLFAGFRGVVGTMWNILDRDAADVADEFYGYLFRNGFNHPDTAEAAQSLHIAVKKLRETKCSFDRWVPFIHLGR